MRDIAPLAQMLGYARQSDQQVDALVHASLDADDDVRNDAVRALEVLAGAKPRPWLNGSPQNLLST